MGNPISRLRLPIDCGYAHRGLLFDQPDRQWLYGVGVAAAALPGARPNPKTASNSQISLNESYGHSWAETTPINHINIGAAAELRLKTAAAALTCAENLM